MIHPQIAAFARLANGAQLPQRKIEGASTLLARTVHSIEYDAIHDEISVPQGFAGAVMTFKGDSNGEVAPLRVIQGPKTQIGDPSRLAVDPANNEIYVPLGSRVLVFPREGNGNIAPTRILEGPATQLGAGALAVDAMHNLLIAVGNPSGGGPGRGTQILMFERTAAGNTKPLRVVGGPKTKLTTTGGPFTIYAPKGRILVPIRGDISTAEMMAPDSFLGVWNETDSGDVAPHWTIGGPRGIFEMIRGVAVNAKYKEVIVSDKRLNAVLTFSVPEIF
ncbi:MAG: hypothetical protein EXQ56_04240 [Acidobacteria bacterium]|nr:hypothetical protein [Acidobacteriota bacterium]